MKQVSIYTDGSCEPNPGKGGWAAILYYKGKEKCLIGSESESTNNRMELTAVIEALSILKEPCEVTVFTDSQYLARGATGENQNKKNLDLWLRLDEEMEQHEVHWKWVRGHAGDPLNHKVHVLAQEACRNQSRTQEF